MPATLLNRNAVHFTVTLLFALLAVLSLYALPAGAIVLLPRDAEGQLTDPFAALTPLGSGSGVVVCAPGGGMADFGAGCSRWLQFHLADYGALGKMPLQSDLYHRIEERGKADMRLTLDEALQIGKCVGVTHIAMAALTGAPEQAALSYQLVEVKTKKPVGAPVGASGSREQILAQLPRIGQEMAKALGVKNPEIAPAVRLTPAEMETCGRFVWTSVPNLTAQESGALATMIDKDPLSLLMAMRSLEFLDTAATSRLQRIIVPAGAGHLALMAEVVLTKPGAISSSDAEAEAKAKSYPNSYLAQLTAAHVLRNKGDHAAELAAAERAVRCAPDNAQPWLTLAKLYADSAERVRRGRLAAALTREEWAELAGLYLRETLAVARSVERDDRSAHAWSRLAVAATFAGQHDLATRAYEKAIALDPNSAEVMMWGKEMFQPKWLDDEARLKGVLAQAQKATYKDAGYAVQMSLVLEQFGMDGVPIRAKFEAQQKAQISQNPKRLLPYINLGYLYERTVRYADAARMYEQIVDQGLQNASYMSRAAGLFSRAGDKQQASRAASKQALIAQANRPPGQANAGPAAPVETAAVQAEKRFYAARDLLKNKDFEGYLKGMREVVRLDPNNPAYHYEIGSYLAGKGRWTEATPELLQSADLDSTDSYCLHAFYRLNENNLKQEALEVARKALNKTAHTKPNLYMAVGQDYLDNDRITEADRAADIAIEALKSPQADLYFEPGVYLLRGDVYQKQGKTEQARLAWQAAANSKSKAAFVQEAQKRLAGLAAAAAPAGTKPANVGATGPSKATGAKSTGDVAATQNRPAPANSSAGENSGVPRSGASSSASSPFGGPAPKTAAEFVKRAQSLQINEYKEQIEKDYREAIRLEPRNASYHIHLSGLLQNVGRNEEALKEIKAALKLAPSDANYELLWGCSINLNRQQDAIAALKEGAKQKVPTATSLYSRLADHYLQSGDYEAAQRAAERGLETFAHNKYPLRNFTPGLNFQIGEALFKQGKLKQAREYWQKAAAYESQQELNGMAQAKKRLAENP